MSVTSSFSVVGGIAAGGACGAVARYGVSVAAGRIGEGWPWGTMVVNLLGCVAIGALLAATVAPEGAGRWDAGPVWRAAAVVGFVGSFTTFSTYAWEAFDLVSDGKVWRAGAYVVVSNVVGVVAVWAGWKVFGRVMG